MILTCEKCHTRYTLPARMIGEEGHKVRCSLCGHEWHQGPEESEEPEEIIVEEEEEDDELPPPPRPEPPPRSFREQADVPAIREAPPEDFPPPEDHETRKGKLAGYGGGLVVFAMTFVLILALNAPVSRMWPATAGFYEFFGIKVPVEGEGLIFDQLKAVAAVNEQGVKVLTLTGKIINLQRRESKIPAVRATLRFEDGRELDSWILDIPEKDIPGENEIQIRSTYPGVPDDIKEVNVQMLSSHAQEPLKEDKAEDEPPVEPEHHDDAHVPNPPPAENHH